MSKAPERVAAGLTQGELLTFVERLSEAPSLDAAVDLLCRIVVTASGYRRAYFAALMPASGHVFGSAGLAPDERRQLREAQRRFGATERAENRRRVLALHRIAPDLDVAFIPVGQREGLPDVVLGASLDAAAGPGAWQPGDDLVFVPHAADGAPLGMLAVADPADGSRPTDGDVSRLASLHDLIRAASGVLHARDRDRDAGMSESRRILAYVETLTQTSERQELGDQIAEHCARIAGYQSAVLTVHMDDGPLIGAWNLTADQRAGLREAAERTPPERSAKKRRVLRGHAFPGTGICYIPHDVDLARSTGFVRSQPDVEGTWHPEDRLFLLVETDRRIDIGVLSLDLPEDGTAPTEERLGRLRTAERFLQLGATLLQARMIDAHLSRSNRLEALGTLAAGVAHDFNNIIGVILGYSSLLRMQAEGDDDLERMTGAIETSAQRAAALTARLRGLTRAESGQQQPVDIAALVQDCVRVASETFDRRIEVTYDVDEDLPSVSGETGALYRSLMNICVNARDAMPEGGRLSIVARTERRPGFLEGNAETPWVHILVDDSGEGIDPALWDRVFEPFFTTRARSENRGLGLFMAYNVVRSLHGTVQVTRSPLGGTRVRIMLPGTPVDDADKAPDMTDARVLEDTPVAPAHILCVEDEEMLQEVMTSVLEMSGHSVDVVGDGQTAIDVLTERAGVYDLVVLDLVLPRKSGIDVFRHLQTVRADLPVLVSSGNVEEGLSDASLLEKVTATLPKPWAVEDFQGAVNQILRARQQG